MAACGSLQHIFENPLPENPTTLLESLSSWNQIKPEKPIEQPSFTEIFGELHFNAYILLDKRTESEDWREREKLRSFNITNRTGEREREKLYRPPIIVRNVNINNFIFFCSKCVARCRAEHLDQWQRGSKPRRHLKKKKKF